MNGAAAGLDQSFKPKHLLILALLGTAYAAFVIPNWSEAYIDFGDGNYLYIATRITQGAVVYRDILAPQPPCHLFLGAFLIKLAGWLNLASPLYLVRAFSLLLHLASFFLAADLGRKAWGSAKAGVISGAVFLLLPLNLWWSMGYESENLEILFLLLMIRFALNATRPSDVLTGLFGALAALTNLTAALFLLVLAIFMFIRNLKRALWIVIPAATLAIAVTVILEIWTSGAFLQNTVFNQVGTYPPGRFLQYTRDKILREGGDILRLEWPFLLLAAIGLFSYFRDSPLDRDARDGLGCFGISTLFSFLYLSKGGTEDYIFTLAGPAIAILSPGGARILEGLLAKDIKWLPPRSLVQALVKFGTLGLIAALLFVKPLRPIVRHYVSLWKQSAFELPDLPPERIVLDGVPRSNVQQVKDWIERYSKPGETILSPPFYAFLTGRRIWGDYSEIFIWTIKDHNDRVAGREDGEGWLKTRDMAQAIQNRELPLVIIEMDQTGRLPEIRAALERSYQSILKEPYRTLNTRLGVFIPK